VRRARPAPLCGDEMVLQDTLNAQTVLQHFLSLIMRYWNAIADTLHSGEVFLPLLCWSLVHFWI
jgi:hypothetical protein